MWLGSHYDAVTLFSFIYIMLEPLNSLDTGSYIEKCFLLFDFLSIFFDLYRRPVFGPIRNDSIISISSISEIQYRYIPHNIYIILYIIYLLYLDMPLFLSVQFWILERSILFFFFFILAFTFSNETRGVFHYDLNYTFIFHFILILFLGQTLYNITKKRKRKFLVLLI